MKLLRGVFLLLFLVTMAAAGQRAWAGGLVDVDVRQTALSSGRWQVDVTVTNHVNQAGHSLNRNWPVTILGFRNIHAIGGITGPAGWTWSTADWNWKDVTWVNPPDFLVTEHTAAERPDGIQAGQSKAFSFVVAHRLRNLDWFVGASLGYRAWAGDRSDVAFWSESGFSVAWLGSHGEGAPTTVPGPLPYFLQSDYAYDADGNIVPLGHGYPRDGDGNLIVSGTQDTIETRGSGLLCMAMALENFRAQHAPLSPVIDPWDLNTWLRDHDGFNLDNDLRWEATEPYTDGRVRLEAFEDWSHLAALAPADFPAGVPTDLRAHIDTEILFPRVLASLQRGEPAIVQLRTSSGGSHFVLVVGTEGTPDDFVLTVKDPGSGGRARYASDPTDSNYAPPAFPYAVGLRTYAWGSTAPSDPKSFLAIDTHCPVHVLVRSPSGLLLGRDEGTGTHYEEIPGGVYFTDNVDPRAVAGHESSAEGPDAHPSKRILIAVPEAGDYEIQVFGLDRGTYKVECTLTNEDGEVSTTTVGGFTDAGQVAEAELPVDPLGGLEPESLVRPVADIDLMQSITTAWDLGAITRKGVARSLIAKAWVAEKALARGRTKLACVVLRVLRFQLSALRGTHIEADTADILEAEVAAVLGSLDCPSPRKAFASTARDG